jgi:glycosyltransferase involved in cell wall biosynthesis
MKIALGEVNDRFWPKITIVTPSFNQGQYLEKTILSVLNQNYPNLEYMIIDGGSTDNSVGIIRRYEKFLKYWVSEPDSGQSQAINKGFQHATGDIFGWLNSDDYLMPGALGVISHMFLSNPDAGAYVGAGEFVNHKGKTLERRVPSEISLEILYNWLNDFQIMQPSCFFTRTAWNKVGGLDEAIHFAMDVDLWLKIARYFPIVTTCELLSRSLVHGRAKTKAHRYLCEVDTALVILQNGGTKQAREHLEKIAAKLEFYEKWLKPLTANPLFGFLLPYIKRFIGYDRHLNSLNLQRPKK